MGKVDNIIIFHLLHRLVRFLHDLSRLSSILIKQASHQQNTTALEIFEECTFRQGFYNVSTHVKIFLYVAITHG